ncbi:MarR family transcriptional regulator, transcriptional regulator for hemolysin [Burkholderia sp. WP9]|uniref:MarR family winged helix-turn-helix transcriptional regulator n=1 Tax=Burkholderia sp. WP9 TaxID=1500263 RepID=UPI0008984038|nr:MarR family winged helix-turn-helix transcriptional regulator [Burkholderia sp. WP9]SEF12590.1 MarR family transcriptional regulator, transcriptional regulator for hemolysin [Burkholderia sp. WP9]
MTSLNELRFTVCGMLVPAAVNLRRISDAILKAYGLSSATAAPLLMIARLGDGIYQVTVAEHLGLGTSALVRTLDQLSAAGLVDRTSDKADHRAKVLSLTRKGAEAAKAARNALVALEADIFIGCTRAELEAAMRVLEAAAGMGRGSGEAG